MSGVYDLAVSMCMIMLAFMLCVLGTVLLAIDWFVNDIIGKLVKILKKYVFNLAVRLKNVLESMKHKYVKDETLN